MPKYEDKKTNGSKGESKPNYHDSNMSREAQEKAEGLDTKTEGTAPETRYQDKQQISEVIKSTEANTPKTGFNKTKTAAGGSAVKQAVAAKVLLADADYAGAPGGVTQSASRSGLKTMQYSGDAGTILGSAANTPVVGSPSRSDQRFGKQLDATMKKINFLASEQAVTEYQNPAPLGESADKVQGYYGTPKNASIRSQKCEGGTPADMLVERSADEITEDMLFYINGQYVKGDLPSNAQMVYGVEPTKITTFDANGIRATQELAGDDAIIYGNYLPRRVRFTFSKTRVGGTVTLRSIRYSVDDISITDESQDVANSSSTAFIRDMNCDEIARQNIDSKAGRETELNWSPLGRAVEEPTATVGFLQRIEADLGARVYASYKFGSKAHAYQLNKTAKDGQRVHTPALEMMLGAIVSNISSEDYTGGAYFNGYSSAFDKAAMQRGAASLLIAINDSTSKYETKADFLVQPKSLRHAFQIADNSMNVFRLKREFAAALNNEDVFSTIDRGYDPFLPVCITDRVGLISCIDYSRFGDMTADAQGILQYDHPAFQYAYANRSSNYLTVVEHPLLAGIKDYIVSKATRIYDVLKDSKDSVGDITLDVPIVSCSTCFSLWDFLIMEAVPYMVKRRINALRDVLDFEVNFEYPFNLDAIKDLNPNNAVNYGFKSIDEPLETRQMIPSAAIRWIMPEFFWGIGRGSHKQGRYVSPWYFNEMQFELQGHAANDVGNKAKFTKGFDMPYMNGVMSLPVIRNGVRLGYLDDVYNMSERDVRLCLDRMTRLPIGASSDNDFNVYKYGQANEGIPIVEGDFTIKDYLCTPRELGMFMHAPHGLLRVQDNKDPIVNGFAGFAQITDDMLGNTSYRLRCWKGAQTVPTEILGTAAVAINRAQAFKQYWDESPACLMAGIGGAPEVEGYRSRREVGFLVSMRQCFNNTNATAIGLKDNQGTFIPATLGQGANCNSAQYKSYDAELRVIAFHKGLWGRLQRLPMVISPFDTCDFNAGSGANYDPYDFAYMFGFAGMMASDYNQDLYNRTNHIQDQGWLYTVDDFIKDSPVFKDSIKYTI